MRRDMGLPFRHWFNQPEHEALGHFKDSFISNTSNTYTDLSEAELEAMRQVRGSRRLGRGVIPHFDDETLGGHVSCSALIDPARRLKGKLRGPLVRYESQSA